MDIQVFDLGLSDFPRSYEFQNHVFNKVKSGSIQSALVICRHRPVITLGRTSDKNNVLNSSGIAVHLLERGGDVTYHGPGQLTIYPIFNLAFFRKDLHWFLRELEQAAIDLLAEFGVKAERRQGLTGVWVNGEKIASIGIAVRNWISFHGISINIKKDDLANFKLIRPCGMDISMTSLETATGSSIDIEEVKKKAINRFIAFDSKCSTPLIMSKVVF